MRQARIQGPSGPFSLIAPGDYIPAAHDGHILCPGPDCHARLNFVSGHPVSGGRRRVSEHFRTARGSIHGDNCPFQPESGGESDQSISKEAFVLHGGNLLLNLNFDTSFRQAPLKQRFARAALRQVGGRFDKDWMRDNHDRYITAPAQSVQALAAQAHQFASMGSGRGMKLAGERLWVHYLHGILPWNRFYLRNTPAAEAERRGDVSYMDQLFTVLQNSFQNLREGQNRVWAPFPSLRYGLKLLPGDMQTGRGLKFEAHGMNNAVTDTLAVKGDLLRQQILRRAQDGGKISFCSTGFAVRDEKGRIANTINWPITDMRQIIFHEPE